MTRWRVAGPIALVALVGAACAGDDGNGGRPTPEATLAPAPSSTVGSESGVTATGPASTSDVAIAIAPEAFDVSISVSVPASRLDVALAVGFDSAHLADLDPFGRFAACSGLRTAIRTYAVSVSDPAGSIRSASVMTVGDVSGPGVYVADIRIEPLAGSAISGTGTLTLDDGLRAGRFTGTDARGDVVTGEFACSGPGTTPVPLVSGPDDGVLDAIEVSALLGRDGLERVVGLTVDGLAPSSPGGPARPDVDCPAVSGSGRDGLLRAVGDQSLGSIAELEVAADSVVLGVGGSVFRFEDATVRTADGATGTFSAVTSDGVTVDGAFRCT